MTDLDMFPRMASLEAVVARGGVRAAAVALRTSKATISRHVQELEEGVGTRLLDRSTRRVKLTGEGAELLERFRALRAGWEAAIDAVQERCEQAHGVVRVSAPHLIATRMLAGVVTELCARHPALTVDVTASDAIVDLVDGSVDVALRAGPLADSSLHATKLFEATEVLVGAPRLLGDAAPTREQINALPWVIHTAIPVDNRRTLRDPLGRAGRFEMDQRILARTSDAFLALLLEGAGLGVVPDAFIRAELESGALRALSWYGRKVPLYAVFAGAGRVPRRVQVLLDQLRAALVR